MKRTMEIEIDTDKYPWDARVGVDEETSQEEMALMAISAMQFFVEQHTDKDAALNVLVKVVKEYNKWLDKEGSEDIALLLN